jgi:putative Mn2+ efflux pump MntP
MGMFQFLMPIAGSLLGEELAGPLATYGKFVAAALVFAVGAKMLYEAVKSHPGVAAERAEHSIESHTHQSADPTRGWSLLVLSVATSVDALVVGFSLGLKGQTEIVGPSVVIGVVAAAMALIGVTIGQRAGNRFGKTAEIVGAALLMLLGLAFLLPGM